MEYRVFIDHRTNRSIMNREYDGMIDLVMDGYLCYWSKYRLHNHIDIIEYGLSTRLWIYKREGWRRRNSRLECMIEYYVGIVVIRGRWK